MKIFVKPFRVSEAIVLIGIRGYRAVFSLDHGAFGALIKGALPYSGALCGCRFSPSCSAYAEDAIRQYGLLAGVMVSCGRILRCHPWSRGGYDPVLESRIMKQESGIK